MTRPATNSGCVRAEQIQHQATVGVGDEHEGSRQLRGVDQRDHIVDVLLHVMWLRHRGGQVGPVRAVFGRS